MQNIKKKLPESGPLNQTQIHDVFGTKYRDKSLSQYYSCLPAPFPKSGAISFSDFKNRQIAEYNNLGIFSSTSGSLTHTYDVPQGVTSIGVTALGGGAGGTYGDKDDWYDYLRYAHYYEYYGASPWNNTLNSGSGGSAAPVTNLTVSTIKTNKVTVNIGKGGQPAQNGESTTIVGDNTAIAPGGDGSCNNGGQIHVHNNGWYNWWYWGNNWANNYWWWYNYSYYYWNWQLYYYYPYYTYNKYASTPSGDNPGFYFMQYHHNYYWNYWQRELCNIGGVGQGNSIAKGGDSGVNNEKLYVKEHYHYNDWWLYNYYYGYGYYYWGWDWWYNNYEHHTFSQSGEYGGGGAGGSSTFLNRGNYYGWYNYVYRDRNVTYVLIRNVANMTKIGIAARANWSRFESVEVFGLGEGDCYPSDMESITQSIRPYDNYFVVTQKGKTQDFSSSQKVTTNTFHLTGHNYYYDEVEIQLPSYVSDGNYSILLKIDGQWENFWEAEDTVTVYTKKQKLNKVCHVQGDRHTTFEELWDTHKYKDDSTGQEYVIAGIDPYHYFDRYWHSYYNEWYYPYYSYHWNWYYGYYGNYYYWNNVKKMTKDEFFAIPSGSHVWFYDNYYGNYRWNSWLNWRGDRHANWFFVEDSDIYPSIIVQNGDDTIEYSKKRGQEFILENGLDVVQKQTREGYDNDHMPGSGGNGFAQITSWTYDVPGIYYFSVPYGTSTVTVRANGFGTTSATVSTFNNLAAGDILEVLIGDSTVKDTYVTNVGTGDDIESLGGLGTNNATVTLTVPTVNYRFLKENKL